MQNSRKILFQSRRNDFLSMINFYFEIYRVDLVELGNDKIWGSGGGYRDLRPYSCCGGLPPDEEMEWHVHHIKNCLTYVDEMQDFYRQLKDFIERKGKELNKKKKQAIKRIETKDTTKTCFEYSKHAAPINKCTNSQQLAEKELEITKEIEQLSSQAQIDEDQREKQGEENNKRQEEWEKCNQEETEFNRLSSLILGSQDLTTIEKNYQIVKNNPLYTTSKKTFLGDFDNKTLLDIYFNARKNLFTASQEEQSEENSDSQGNHKSDEEINNELKRLDLEKELEQLKNQKPEAPEQQAENQKKIEEKEKELEEIKNNPSVQQQPLIDVTEIEQVENIMEATTITKNQIQQVLAFHNLKTTDLPKQYKDWEKQLSKLDSKDKIIAFVEEMNRQIKNNFQEVKKVQGQGSNNKQQPVSFSTKLLVGGGIIILTIFIFLVLLKKKKTNKTI